MTVLNDNFEETLWPLFRFKPAFSYATAIYSDLERFKLNSNLKLGSIIGNRHKKFYQNFCNRVGDIQLGESSSKIKPVDLLNRFHTDLDSDLRFLSRDNFHNNHKNFKGNTASLWLHNDCKIADLAFIDCSEGAVVIDEGAEVSPFSLLKGPLFIGKNSFLNKANISKSRIGKVCKIGGEVSEVIMGNYSNKVHEGFLGHSLIGDWVNLGALTTTSNLKNNYGQVRLYYENIVFDSGSIKFGSIIGDFTKTAIGTMLNTGTTIDVGCLLSQNFPNLKYFPPFFWGGSKPSRYELERFKNDMTSIMARRNQSPEEYLIEMITTLHNG